MPRLQVLIDGQEQFNGDVPTWTIPTTPQTFPAALQPATATTPLSRLMFTKILLDLAAGLLTQHPNTGLSKAQVTVNTSDTTKFTLTIDKPLGNDAG